MQVLRLPLVKIGQRKGLYQYRQVRKNALLYG